MAVTLRNIEALDERLKAIEAVMPEVKKFLGLEEETPAEGGETSENSEPTTPLAGHEE